MSEPRHVEARWQGGLAAVVTARDHELIADEPETYGGADQGMMPTELFFAGLASCFCLAVAHVAAKRDIELPGLRVSVDAERVGRRLRAAVVDVRSVVLDPDPVVDADAGGADVAPSLFQEPPGGRQQRGRADLRDPVKAAQSGPGVGERRA
ncbi:MAG: OsmC family protein [Actinobacteria bacterium]|nr:OsmC family protein [Actinomycetota bacterium]